MDILAIWILIGGFVGGLVQIILASCADEELSFETAFYYASTFYENNKDNLNSAGLIIVIVGMSLLLLPGYVLIFIAICLHKVSFKLWEAYKYVFRKKERREEEE